jgi:hypothetical protein
MPPDSGEQNHDETDEDLCLYPGQHGPCQNPASEGKRCWLESHTEEVGAEPEAVTDGRGAPEGSQNALGNDGGAPEGNVNGMKHGMHMTAERLMEVMDERQRAELRDTFLDFRSRTNNERQAMKLAVFDVMETTILRDLINESLHEFVQTGDDPEEGYERYMQEKVEAIHGFRREIRLGLHYEGASAQHQGSSSGHGNLDELVESG